MEHKNDAQSGGSRNHFLPAGRRFGCGRAGLIFLSLAMDKEQYNYSEFKASPSEFLDFAQHAPKVTMRAPSFPLEDLATGCTVEMKELWQTGVAVIEFGSFT